MSFFTRLQRRMDLTGIAGRASGSRIVVRFDRLRRIIPEKPSTAWMLRHVRPRRIARQNWERFGNMKQFCVAVESIQPRDLFPLWGVSHLASPGKEKKPESTAIHRVAGAFMRG